jgi:hypothetical protein
MSQQVYGLQYSSLCCTWTVCIQEPVMHLDCLYSRVCSAPRLVCCLQESFFVHLGFLSTRLCDSLVRVRLKEILYCIWTCRPTRVYNSPCCSCSCTLYCLYQNIFWFVSVVSTRVRNTETNRQIYFLVS